MYPHHHFIQCYSHHGRVAVLVEIGLETWLVTERPEFLELSRNLAMHIAALNPESIEALLAQAYARDPSVNVKKLLADASDTLGERVTIARFTRWDNEHAPAPPTEEPTPPRDPAVAIRLKRA